MTKQELAHSIYSPLFAEYSDLKQAYDYASKIASASENPAAVLTAIHVMMNLSLIHISEPTRPY